jgi:hypothetical protein
MSVLLLVRAADIRTLADNTTQQAKKQKSEMATLRPGESPTSQNRALARMRPEPRRIRMQLG